MSDETAGMGEAEKAGGARRRLVELLRQIAELAGERSLKRCPYRSARDVCTFRGECGNRYRAPGCKPLCTGGPLNAKSASPEEVAAALERLETSGDGRRAEARRRSPERAEAAQVNEPEREHEPERVRAGADE